MIRNALLLCAIILTAACFACVQAPPPPGGPSPVKALSVTCSDGSAFLDHVKFVQNGFTPSVTLSAPPPGTGTPIDPNSNYAQNLQNAFSLAPSRFQDRLCGLNGSSLKGIYVNGPVNCTSFDDCFGNSWGYRVWPSQETYIAISAGLWNGTCLDGSSPYGYHCYETDVLNAVLGWPNPPPTNPPRPQYSSANPDTFDMVILAALAHEVGHVRWFEVITPTAPGISGYDPNTFLCTSNPGTPSFFSYSWKQSVQRPPPWRLFLTREKRKNGFGALDLHLLAPQIKDIDKAIDQGHLPAALIDLEKLYQRAQPWASYFGAIAPDEDFVEMYKFYVLTSAQLTNLPITINGVSHDIPNDYLSGYKQNLYNKAQCIGPWI